MRLSVHNLGRIRDAELELQPITVLYGANNSCKTWLANASYSSARRLSLEGRMNGFVWPGPAEGKLHPQLQRIAAEARAALDVRDGAEYSYTLKFADVPGPQDGYVGHAGTLARWLGLPDLLKPDASSRLHRGVEDVPLFDRLTVKIKRNGTRLLVTGELLGEAFDAFPIESTHPRADVDTAALGPVGWLRDSLFRRVFAVTEDRLAHADALGRPPRGPGTADAPSPWSAESSRDTSRALGELCGQTPEMRQNMGGDEVLAELLATDVLGGSVEMAPNGTLSFRQGQTRLPLPAAGSGVRALATFSVYLSFLASPGDLLLFDAPELMLGDAARDALVALLRSMPERGYRLIVPTRSLHVARGLGAAEDAIIYHMEDRADGGVLLRPTDPHSLA